MGKKFRKILERIVGEKWSIIDADLNTTVVIAGSYPCSN